MDVTTLATEIAPVLAPYLVKAGEKAAETVGEKIPGAAGKLWTAAWSRLKGKPAAEEAANDLVATPKAELTQAAFANQIVKVLQAEPDVRGRTNPPPQQCERCKK